MSKKSNSSYEQQFSQCHPSLENKRFVKGRERNHVTNCDIVFNAVGFPQNGIKVHYN